jgi:hypothetical protein
LVTSDVFNGILAFAERKSGWWPNYARAAVFGLLMVRVNILHANQHCAKAWLVDPFGTNHSAIPYVHLDPVVRDGDSNSEPEGIA